MHVRVLSLHIQPYTGNLAPHASTSLRSLKVQYPDFDVPEFNELKDLIIEKTTVPSISEILLYEGHLVDWPAYPDVSGARRSQLPWTHRRTGEITIIDLYEYRLPRLQLHEDYLAQRARMERRRQLAVAAHPDPSEE